MKREKQGLQNNQVKQYFENDANKQSGFYKNGRLESEKKINKRQMWKQYKHSLNKIIKEEEKIEKVIDIACGMGNFTLELKNTNHFKEIIGMDYLKETFNIARQNKKLFKNVEFIQANMLQIPFKDKSFDACFCLNTLHHLQQKEIEITLEEFARITKKYIVIEIRNKNNIFEFWFKHIIIPILYQNLPIYSQSIEKIDSIMKNNNYDLKHIIGKRKHNWMCRSLILIYKKNI